MTSNPLTKNPLTDEAILEGSPMSASGAVNKTIFLVMIVTLFAFCSWAVCAMGYADRAVLMITISAVAGFILAMVAFFKPATSPVVAPAYAICEGILVGVVSFLYSAFYQGIIINAVAITLITLFTMLFLYKTKVIQATEKFGKVIFTSTFAIAIFYFAGIIGAKLGHPMTIFNGGIYGIVISIVFCTIAALNFILDFDFIEQGDCRLPKYFEWYSGLTLLVTVIWLYFEILRLLAQLSRRN